MGLRLEGIETARVLDLAQRSKHIEYKIGAGQDSIHFGIYDAELVEAVSKEWARFDDEHLANSSAIEVVRSFFAKYEWIAKVPKETLSGKKSPHTFHVRRA